MTVRVEPAQPSDVAGVKEVLEVTWKDAYGHFLSSETLQRVRETWHSTEALHLQVGLEGVYFGVAKIEERVVGVTRVKSLSSHTAELSQLYVHPSFQRRGIGEQLLIAAECAFPHVRWLELTVSAENEKGILFYEKHGFREVERRAGNVVGQATNDVIMRKQL